MEETFYFPQRSRQRHLKERPRKNSNLRKNLLKMFSGIILSSIKISKSV